MDEEEELEEEDEEVAEEEVEEDDKGCSGTATPCPHSETLANKAVPKLSAMSFGGLNTELSLSCGFCNILVRYKGLTITNLLVDRIQAIQSQYSDH